MGEATTKTLINRNLISLKFVLFAFFGGLGCLYPFLPIHMLAIGLNKDESRIISIIAPLVAILGPCIIAPVADKIASRNGASYGRFLRIIGSLCMVIAAILYLALMFVPTLVRYETRRPLVSFACDLDGGVIYQERCTEESTCYHWQEEKVGSLILTNCSYTCQKPTEFESLYNSWTKGAPPINEISSELDDDYDELTGSDERSKRDVEYKPLVEPPHICRTSDNKISHCYVYTDDTNSITVGATLNSAINQENDTHSAEWCKYPLNGFQCNIPEPQKVWMKLYMNTSQCNPMIECEVYDPYDSPGSVLAESQCIKVIGDVDLTFWLYLILRSLADTFAIIVVVILSAAIIVATRETSTGRGDVGHQLAFATLGFAIFAPIMGAIGHIPDTPYFLLPIICCVVLLVIAGIVLLLSSNMPLTPPEWWWHTKCGMLAIPMSAIRKYGPEMAALMLVTIVFGIFWSALETYLPWYIMGFPESESVDGSVQLIVGLILLVGALPAIPILWHAEKIVDYCGHSNLLIISFATHIVRYTIFSFIDSPWWTLILKFTEPITLSLTWITIILYVRHIFPRRLTTIGQALPVIAHFCLGKSLGALLGLIKNGNSFESLRCLYRGLAIAAAVVAVLYFLLYHFLLSPRCGAKSQPPPSTSTVGNGSGNGANVNGSYSPLRIYHNYKGRKGHFRY